MNNTLFIDEKQKIKRSDYFVVFLLLCISGNPLVQSFTEYIYIIVVIFLLILSAKKKSPVFTGRIKYFFTVLFLLYVSQFLIVRDVSLPADVNHFAKIYSGCLVILLMGYAFRYIYMRVMTFLCVISFIGFVVNIIIGQFPGIEVDRHVSILLYNYYPDSPGLRNCGMFWEPGAFQGYIMLVFLMYMNDFRLFYRKHKRNFWILTIALITTFSTTGFVVFAFYLFFVFSGNIRKSPIMLFLTIALIYIAVWAFYQYDFLGEKIIKEYEDALEISEGDVSWSRFGSAIVAWNNVLNHPFTGNGFKMSALYGELAEYMSGMGNGFFGAMNQLGIPFLFFYLFLLYRNAPVMSNLNRLGFVFLIVLLLNGEFFLNYPLYWALLFVKYPNLNGNEKISYTPYCA